MRFSTFSIDPSVQTKLTIQLLGGFSVWVCGVQIPEECWHSRRARSLVKLLAVAPDHRLHRDQIANTLWPDSDLAASANNFHQTLHTTRHILTLAGPECLLLEEGALHLMNGASQGLSVDVDQFEEAAKQARQTQETEAYRSALALYTGDLLPDDRYEEWAIPRRETLRQTYLQLLFDLAFLYEKRGEYTPGIETLQRLLAADACNEEAHAALMRLYALNGQRPQALRQYQTLREMLKQDLEVDPSESSTRLYHEILSGGFTPDAPAVHVVHGVDGKPPNNLPIQTTSFIGREKEIAALTQLILSGPSRLVTVTGAGGTGKTRLALRVAADLQDAFSHGIGLVELGSLADPDLVPITVAAALQLREAAGHTILEVLVEYLRSKRVLILLDTCEHLVGAVASLVDTILHAAPQVVILATSREILGVGGEIPFLCPSLALPGAHTLEIEPSCDSVRLFAERSALAAPAFAITPVNAPIVAQVCRRLDGIPLAIELAAARMRILSLEQIAQRLDHAFVLLTGGSRTALPRQQTLKATIDWSYNLLSPAERILLLRLSVFSGGWTLDAAEAVCAGEDSDANNLQPEEILDLLCHLVDKSLILVEPGLANQPRYRMLDTIRQYAGERLLETGTHAHAFVRQRHVAYFLALAEEAGLHLRAWGMLDWLERLEVELDNLRLALEGSLPGSIEQGLRSATALHYLWHLHSRRFEGIQWLERLLDADTADIPNTNDPTRRIIRAKALVVSANLNHYYPGTFTQHAQLQGREAEAIIQSLGDLGERYLHLVYPMGTLENCEKRLALARKASDEFNTAENLFAMVWQVENEGDLDRAMTYAEENLAIRQKLGDLDGGAFAYYLLAEVEFRLGHFQRALELYEKGQRGLFAIGNTEIALYITSFPVRIALAQGDYNNAIQLSQAQLAAGQEISSSIVIADALGLTVWADWALQQYERAVQRCGEVIGPDWENNLPCGRGALFYAFGRVALSQGEYAHAYHYLSHFASVANQESFLSIQAIGILAARQARTKPAAILFGALDAICGWLKNISSPVERSEYEAALASVRAALGEAAFQSAWAEGQAMTRERLQTFTQEVLDSLACLNS